ncbi:hypothetical protein [Streptomyces sp. NPDC059753]|uniref:hypothetical protein n=1 Tax=Streptomyces sp. NPDC059753 TaxID=3346933 RepID=UPI0036625229
MSDDRTALRVITTALRRHGDTAPPLGVARALAALIQLATSLEETDGVDEWRCRLNALDLTDTQRHQVTEGLRNTDALHLWRTEAAPEAGRRTSPDTFAGSNSDVTNGL